jgi:hypothetical protein
MSSPGDADVELLTESDDVRYLRGVRSNRLPGGVGVVELDDASYCVTGLVRLKPDTTAVRPSSG